ncbi:hypothetical protein EDB84DRAFT_1124733 [Lactarius hengduanensis]|nr:hypothetical protein EDB84DRAFT_1124733 [Lactarius hengduanensis]
MFSFARPPRPFATGSMMRTCCICRSSSNRSGRVPPSRPRLGSRDPHRPHLRSRSASRLRPFSLRYNNTPASLYHFLITYNACTLPWSRLSKCNRSRLFSWRPQRFVLRAGNPSPRPSRRPHEACPREANQRLAKITHNELELFSSRQGAHQI